MENLVHKQYLCADLPICTSHLLGHIVKLLCEALPTSPENQIFLSWHNSRVSGQTLSSCTVHLHSDSDHLESYQEFLLYYRCAQPAHSVTYFVLHTPLPEFLSFTTLPLRHTLKVSSWLKHCATFPRQVPCLCCHHFCIVSISLILKYLLEDKLLI